MNKQIASSQAWLRYLAAVCILPVAITGRALAQNAATEKKIPVETAPSTNPAPENDEVLILSPFTVSTKQDIGYRASNTLAGSRLNSKLDDLAAPITVVTKQQLEDTGSRDQNDVFLYEANTEGSLNYTKIQIDRSGLKDNIGGSATSGITAQTSQTSNRIRGLINADMTWNYYPSLQRVRGDTYNADSLEISRGPNSILGGLGSPAGILNQSIASAKINENTNEVNLAIGSYGSYRTSLAINRTLLKDTLAIYLAGLYDDREFSRKPSYDISRRQMGGLTYKPFKTTTIKGFVEGFTNSSRTPNQMTPRDGVTPWLNAGRPVWDPVTRQVTYLDGGAHPNSDGVTYLNSNTQQVAASAYSAALVRIQGDAVLTDRRSTNFVPGLGFVNLGRPTREISPDGSFFWTQAQASTFNIYANPTLSNTALGAASVTGTFTITPVLGGGTTANFNPPTLGMGPGTPYDNWSRRLSTSALPVASAAYDFVGGGVYIAPSINNKSVYDWEKINLNSPNHGETKNTTYNLELEQQITTDLFLSVGWFRQDLDSLENYPLSQQATSTVLIDTNKNLPNGVQNPNYLRPYVDTQDPDTAQTPESNEIYRAMLAYNLDFTKHAGWTKWLGRHRFLAFGQHQEDNLTQMRYRLAFSDPSDPRFLQSTSALPFPGAGGGVNTRASNTGYRFAGNASTTRQAYYIGGPAGTAGSIVTAAPATNVGNPALGTTETSVINAYNYGTSTWDQAAVTYGSELFDAGGGFQRSQKIVNTVNLTAQSHWWDDRIVTTVGVRRDKWMGRNTTTGTDANGNVLAATGPAINAVLYPAGSWRLNEGTLLERWGKAEFLNKDTSSLGIVVRPLPWFSLFVNKSDNFNPPPDARVNLFGERLPTPTGKSRDFGFSVNLLDNKLIARVSIFKTEFKGDRSNGSAFTAVGRVPRQDTSNLKTWAEAVVRIRSNFPGMPAAERQINAPGGTAPTATATQAATNTWLDASVSGNALTPNQIAQVDAMMGGLSSTWPDGAIFGSTQNAVAKGAEFEVIYNPTPNWNIKLTAGKQETTYSDIFPDYERWLAYRMPVWQSAAASDMLASYTQPDGKLFSLQRFWTGYGFGETNISTRVNGADPQSWLNGVVNADLTNARLLQNAAPYGQRKWRGNILTNYLFTHGFMKNVGIGGAVRWEDKAVIGYRGKLGTDNRSTGGDDLSQEWVSADPTKPVYDTDLGVDSFRDLTHLDFWVSYRFKLWGDKIRTKIQLNVTDALENGRLDPVFINFDGTATGFRIVDSRRWTLSAKFEF